MIIDYLAGAYTWVVEAVKTLRFLVNRLIKFILGVPPTTQFREQFGLFYGWLALPLMTGITKATIDKKMMAGVILVSLEITMFFYRFRFMNACAVLF